MNSTSSNRRLRASMTAVGMSLAGAAAATVTPTSLFGDSYIVEDGGRFYSVLDVYIQCGNSNDIVSSVFGVSAYASSFALNNGRTFAHSTAGTNNAWLPAAGQSGWDSFVTCGNRDQASAASTLNMLLDTNWGSGNGSSINSAAGTGGPGWYPAVGSNPSINPYARAGYYNSNTSSINVAKATTDIAGNGIAAGQDLSNYWMIGRFAIDVTNSGSGDNTLTLKFAIAGKQNGATTFTGVTSSAGRFNATLRFAENAAVPCRDLDSNGLVDLGDVAFMLLDFGACPGCPSDLDESGDVSFGDIQLLLLEFGPCA